MSKGIVLSLCDFSGAWSRPFIDMGYTVIRVDPMHDAGRATTEGTTLAGSGKLARMADGGYSLAMTARQLADLFASSSFPSMMLERIAEDSGERLPYRTAIIGVLMAPPCNEFSGSGARWWPEKDADGRTERAVSIVIDCWRVMQLCDPHWWALENPVGRIERLVPELRLPGVKKFVFDPCDYAGFADDPASEAYTKRTCIWGEFNDAFLRDAKLFARREPVMVEKRRKDGSVVRGSWMWANLGGKSERTKALRSKTPQGFARAFAWAQDGESLGNPTHEFNFGNVEDRA